MSRLITTQQKNDTAVFSSKTTGELKDFPMPLGRMEIVYSTHSMPQDVTTEADIDQWLKDREGGFGPGVACPPGGSAISIISFAPGLKSPMRAQAAIGVFYVLEGELTLYLDGGDSRKMKAGDVGVMRGASHSWSNDTPNEGWAKLITFAQSINKA